ncbi:Pycsar system effector family protein [Pseudomonadota bacterium]
MKEQLHGAEAELKLAADAYKKGLGSTRGVETLFRSAYRVQMDLTGLADNKANMMISINGIIISIIIASVAPKLDANPWLLIPSTVFLVGTLTSIIFAILAARPRVSTIPISLQDLKHSKGNILFFGDFANLTQDDFTDGMIELMQDRNVIYETMIRNLYGLGSVLRKKFALLKIAYNAFMAALILGVSSFLGVFVWILKTAPQG